MALPASTHSAPTYSSINLVPLRINVVSDDHSLSIVETLVLDRNCWPIPLTDPLEEAIERNADELTYTLLTDLEVHGMGRTVRHFTGRVELWTQPLHTKIKNQLIPQLRHVAKTTKLRVVKKELSSLSPTTTTGTENSNNKRKRDEASDKSKEKAQAQDEEEEEAKAATAAIKEETTKPTVAPPPVTKKKKKASLVPVRLRLCVNGIRIHDDFIWDLSVPQCPIEFAKSLGKDLNLPDEAIAAIVTSIVEQLDGSMVDDTKDLDTASSGSGSAAALRKNATAAWALEHRVHIANMQQLLTMHRPATGTTTTAQTTNATTTSSSQPHHHSVQTYSSG